MPTSAIAIVALTGWLVALCVARVARAQRRTIATLEAVNVLKAGVQAEQASLIAALKRANEEKDRALNDVISAVADDSRAEWFKWIPADVMADRKAVVR